MSLRDSASKPAGEEPWLRQDWLASAALFFLTAGVVVWQNLRLGVLWDLSYILETAHRISLGDIPYRDFPLPYAPGTFLVQAAIMKITGRVFLHHIIYCAAAGGLGTVLAWRIMTNVLRGAVTSPRFIAFVLSVPLTVLGIYCIYPHPFYDPDCTFAIMAGILLLQNLERRGFPPAGSFFTGMVLVIPMFVKQNTGLAFLGSVGGAIVVLLAIEVWHRRRAAGHALVMVGAVTALGAASLMIHFTSGLGNYWHWTVQFAAARRMPGLGDMLAQYHIHSLFLWIPAFAAGALLLARTAWKGRAMGANVMRMLGVASVMLMSLPFIWAVIYMFIDDDSSERAERLLVLWPFVLIVSLAVALSSVRKRTGMALMLPFIVIATVQGAFLSQQLWGSTYALWPLLMILIATIITGLTEMSKEGGGGRIVAFACVIAATMSAAGGAYVWSHERLDYANVSDGEMARSTLPALKGLSVRGAWIPQFEQLVRYAQQQIPARDGLLMIPGEDLFYFTTGRHPQFPALMFDHTVNPYSPEEIIQISRARDIRWLVVKRELQIQDQPVEDEAHLLDLLREDFKPVAALGNYDVYQRK